MKRHLYPMQPPDQRGFVGTVETSRSPQQPLAEHSDRAAYGVRDGKPLFIEDVPRGLACDCVCACCGRPLIAKKGFERRHHFAHLEIADCRGAPESVLHLLAKELLAGLHWLMIPSYEFRWQRKTKAGTLVEHQAIVATEERVRIHSVKVEESEEGFVPDIIIESDSALLIVEVVVSNRVTRTKLRKMRKRNLRVIEIRLDPADSFLARGVLNAKLQCDLASKVWLFHPDQREAERMCLSKWRDAIARDRKWSPIPFPRSLAHTPAASRSESPSRPQPTLDKYDQVMDEFHRTHGRYPTVDECLRLWPRLWKPVS
jgi:hypothetical protein